MFAGHRVIVIETPGHTKGSLYTIIYLWFVSLDFSLMSWLSVKQDMSAIISPTVA